MRMTNGNHIAVGKQPVINGVVIDCGAISGLQIHQDCVSTIPNDFGVLAGNPSVWQPEISIVSATNNIGTLHYMIGP